MGNGANESISSDNEDPAETSKVEAADPEMLETRTVRVPNDQLYFHIFSSL
jgi:hypothetical protein